MTRKLREKHCATQGPKGDPQLKLSCQGLLANTRRKWCDACFPHIRDKQLKDGLKDHRRRERTGGKVKRRSTYGGRPTTLMQAILKAGVSANPAKYLAAHGGKVLEEHKDSVEEAMRLMKKGPLTAKS